MGGVTSREMKKIRIGNGDVAIKGTHSGDLPVIFAVHGAGGGAWMWKDLRAELAEHADLLAIDLPSHGASTGDASQRVDSYRDIVREAARGMGIARPFAMGHSMGGAIALDWAINHPQELAGIILVSTDAKLKVHPMVFEAIEKSYESYVSMIGTLAFGPKTDKEIIELSGKAFLQVSPEVTAGDFRACDAFDVMSAVSNISVPTLVLCGSEDKMTQPKYSEYLAGHIKGSVLKIFSGAGHMLPLERPESVADYVRRFIYDNSARH